MKSFFIKGRPARKFYLLSLMVIVLAGLLWLGVTLWQGLDLGNNLSVVPGAVTLVTRLTQFIRVQPASNLPALSPK